MNIGIDHGYYAIKTAHVSFPTGLTGEDWMIAKLLGHKTMQSVHHYRRIGNRMMADETRKTRENMDLILMDVIKGWDGYEI